MSDQPDYDALAAKYGGAPDYDALAAQYGAVTSPVVAAPSALNSLLPAAALAANAGPTVANAVTSAAKTALASPNAPRIIQRAIGAGVRGVSTAVGGAVGGVPGAITAATVSQGLTPTQQTIRGWLGREATKAVASATSAVETGGDAVENYITAMGADLNNLTGAALEYAKKAGRAILYDANGQASLVPTAEHAAATTADTAAAAPAATSGWFAPVMNVLEKVSPYLTAISAVQAEGDALQRLNTPDKYAPLVDYLVKTRGLTPLDAIQRVTGGDPRLSGQLMMRYTQAPSVKK